MLSRAILSGNALSTFAEINPHWANDYRGPSGHACSQTDALYGCQTQLLPSRGRENSIKDWRFLRSDFLPVLRPFLRSWSQFAEVLPSVPQVHIVIDASVAIADVMWTARHSEGRRAGPRTAIAELMAAEAVLPVAPKSMPDEVERHLDRVAHQQGVDVDLARALWAEYRARIRIVDTLPGRVPKDVPDADDLPYAWLQDQFGAAGIATRNVRHMEAIGGRTIGIGVFIALRDYSRDVSVELTVVFAGVSFSVAGIEAIGSLTCLLRWVADRVKALPAAAQLLLLAAVVAIIASPRARAKLHELIRSSYAAAAPIWAELAPKLEAYALRHAEAQLRRTGLEEKVRELFPAPYGLTARAHILRSLASASDPINVDGLLALMREGGYTSQATYPRSYVRRILHSDPRCVQDPHGRWRLRIA